MEFFDIGWLLELLNFSRIRSNTFIIHHLTQKLYTGLPELAFVFVGSNSCILQSGQSYFESLIMLFVSGTTDKHIVNHTHHALEVSKNRRHFLLKEFGS